MKDLSNASPSEVRQLIRSGVPFNTTAGVCNGYAQANLVILPKKLSYDFLLFAQRNSKPCPILEVTDVGSKSLKYVASNADICTDIPKYRIYKKGELQGEYDEITSIWKDDYVSFLLGCSYSFEEALVQEGIEMKHAKKGCKVPMYITNIQCKPAGIFAGPTVVSMRPIPIEKVVKAVQVTSKYPNVHGAPIHIGNPKTIGIKDIYNPDFGDPVEIGENEIPVFWACGVTPQAVAMNVKSEIMITHAPGVMFITDVKNQELAAF